MCIICACLPSLRPVLVRIFPYASSFGSSNGRSGKRSQNPLTSNRKWTQTNGINRLSSNPGSLRHDSEQALGDDIELSDTKSLKGGIQVVSTSEVYSERAPSGVSRSTSTGSRDARSPVPPDHWGYTVGVQASPH